MVCLSLFQLSCVKNGACVSSEALKTLKRCVIYTYAPSVPPESNIAIPLTHTPHIHSYAAWHTQISRKSHITPCGSDMANARSTLQMATLYADPVLITTVPFTPNKTFAPEAVCQQSVSYFSVLFPISYNHTREQPTIFYSRKLIERSASSTWPLLDYADGLNKLFLFVLTNFILYKCFTATCYNLKLNSCNS